MDDKQNEKQNDKQNDKLNELCMDFDRHTVWLIHNHSQSTQLMLRIGERCEN